jgi:hypothetical protein
VREGDHGILELMTHEQIEDVAVRGELDARGLRSLEYDTHPRLAGEGDEVRHKIYGHVVGQLLALFDSTL